MTKEQQKIVNIYEQLFKYKHLLKGAPMLSFAPEQTQKAEFEASFELLKGELEAVIGFLLGLRIDDLTVGNMLENLSKYYKKDDFWRRLLLDYIEIRQTQDEQKLSEHKEQVQQQGWELYDKIARYNKQRREIINAFSQKLEERHFPINSKRLFKNYLNMADIDPDKAWNEIISNPAAFAPIIVNNPAGERIISPSAAKKANKEIGSFIKKLKA